MNILYNLLLITLCLKEYIYPYSGITQFKFAKYPFNIININSLKYHSSNEPNILEYSYKTDYIFRLFTDDLYFNITIGSPKQIIPIIWNMNQYSFKIYAGSYNNNISSTYKNYSDNYKYTFDEINDAIISQDIFYFTNDNNINFFSEIKFILIKNFEKNYSFLGLQLPDITTDDLLTFTKEMKINKIINKYIFFILYSEKNYFYGNDEGILYFGDYPHNINIFNKKFNKNYFYEIKASVRNKLSYWDILFDNIYFSNENNSLNIKYKQVELHGNMQLSIGTDKYYKFIKKNFFEEYIKENICEEKTIINITDYIYFKCRLNNKLNLSKFPTLIFELKEINFNFSLNYNDLFFIHDNNIYFGIVFDKFFPLKFGQRWKLGSIFFKKYLLVFNQDSKTIGIYNNIIKNINIFNSNEKKSAVNFIKIFVIIIIFLVIIFLFYRYIKRKKNKWINKYNNEPNLARNSKNKNEIHIYYELNSDLIQN